MNGKYAVITGPSRGLGQHLARRFWKEGFSLGLIGRDALAIRHSLNDFDHSDDQILDVFQCDVSDHTSVQRIANEVLNLRKEVNVIINNAGSHGPVGSLVDNDLDDWYQTLRTNLLGPVALCKYLLPCMYEARDAAIINISGGGATGPRANFSAYSSSKAALVRFSETLAEELKTRSITVNCVAPGAMRTDMLAEVLKIGPESAGEREYYAAKKIFEGEGASMDRVADLISFLASPDGRGITGKLISAVWDKWENWPNHIAELTDTDLYSLRRITGRDRNCDWGDR